MSHTDNPPSAWMLIFLSWIIALVSTLGSLFFSEVMGLVPCVLCWYQRILIFPLSLILLLGLFPLDKSIIKYSLPFAVLGLLFTVYHLFLFYGFIPEDLKPCTQGIPCDDDSMILFDVLPIPWLSLLAFGGITALLISARSRMKS